MKELPELLQYTALFAAAALARLTGKQSARMMRAHDRKQRDRRNKIARKSRRRNR